MCFFAKIVVIYGWDGRKNASREVKNISQERKNRGRGKIEV